MSRRSPLDRSDPELFGRLLAIEARLGSAASPLLAFVLIGLAVIAFGGGELRRLAAAGFPAMLAPLGASVLLSAILFAPLRLRRAHQVDAAIELLPAGASERDRILGLLCGDERVGWIAGQIAARLRHEPLPRGTAVPAGAGSLRTRAPEWIGALWRTDRALHDVGFDRGSWTTVLLVATWIPAILCSLLLYPRDPELREIARTVGLPFICAGLLLAIPQWISGWLAWRRRREPLVSALAADGIRLPEATAELEALGLGRELCRRLGHPHRSRTRARLRNRRASTRGEGDRATDSGHEEERR